MIRFRALAILAIFCVLSIHRATAQTPATGLYAFGSFDNRGFDSINVGNLNIHFEIPLASKPGRGLNFDYRMVYDSLFWTPSGVSGSQNWVPGDGFGFRGQLSGSVYAGYLTYSTLVGPGCYIGSRYVKGTTITNWVYHDPYGKNHRFNYSDSFDVCGDPDVYTGNGSTNDGSGYFLGPDAATGNLDGYVHGRNGLILNVPQNPTAPSSSSITDTNGNIINNNGNGTFTDTLGTTALTIGGSGNASSARTFTYNVAQQVDNSTTATTTMSYVTYTLQTNFGCSGISEYGPMSVDLPDRITLADGTYYQFSYEGTPGYSGNVTGRLASITLPTGGTINYSYSGGCGNGMDPDGTTNNLNRVTSDGTRYYGRTPVNANATNTTLVDEANNQTLHQFTIVNSSFYETHRQVYQGSGGTPLLDQQTCYNGATSSCDGATITLPITQIQVMASQNGGAQSKKIDSYNSSSGFLTGEQLYDYGGALLQNTTYSYVAPGRLSNVLIKDGSNNQLSQINYGYDEQTPAATSNIPQHTAVAGPRGNQTSTTSWVNAPSSTVQVKYTYDDTGQVTSIQDGRGNTTTYTYDSATNGFLTNTAYPTANLSTSALHDAASGVLLSTTDMSSQTTTYKYYDRLLRLAEVDYPDGGKTLYSHPSATEQSVSMLQQGSTYIASVTDSDGYGRQSQVTRHDPVAGDSYINYTYYPNGLVHTTTNPHRSASSSTDGATTYAYDALGRPTGVTLPDNTNQQLIYSSNTVTKQDASGSQWGYTMDALGRLTKVIEPNSAETDYAYNIFTTTVTQKGVSGETPRPARTFTTDSLGRTVSVVELESGTTGYVYDNNSNLSTKTDARGITTTYNYDPINRVTSIGYSDGTPGNYYIYDVAPSWMSDLQNVKGRLANSSNQFGGGNNGKATATTYSYDAMGRILRTWEQTPVTSPSGFFVYSKYDLAGDLTDLTYPDGRHITQSWDGAGHLSNVVFADWNGQAVNYSYWSSPTYYPNGSLHSAALGNGTTLTFNMNNRLQSIETVAQMSATWSNQTVLDKQYCYGPAATGCPSFNVPNKGNIYGVNDALSAARYQGFGYDNLNRLTGFQTGDNSLSQTYLYDSFGNMNQAGPGTLQSNLGFSPYNQINNTGYGYDQAGNLTQTSNGAGTNTSFTYDAESRLSNINNGTASYIYNESGQRTRKYFSGGWTDYVYFNGQPIFEYRADGTMSDYIYANGQRIAQADSFDARIHFTGTNCCGGGQYSQYTIPMPAITIQSGDEIAWRQYQSGPAVPRGGLTLWFTDGTVTNWVTTDQNGQNMNDLTTQNTWVDRVANLSRQHAGKTIKGAWINSDINTGAGDWNEYFADIALYRQDGTVIPVYHRQVSVSYPALSSSGVSNQTFTIERINDNGDAMNSAHTATYYVGDQIGSTRMLLAGGGWPVSSSTFYPFGQEAQNAGDPNHYKFTGLERDEQNGEAGLDHAMFRQYSSAAGRWMSPDPYGGSYDFSDPQSFNRYSYVGNGPLSAVDPLGTNISRNPSVAHCELSAHCLGDGTPCGSLYGCLPADDGTTITVTAYPDDPFMPYYPDPGGGGDIGDSDTGNVGPAPTAPSNGRNCSPGSASAGQYAAATAQVAAMTAQFFSGLGPTNQTFGPGSATSQVMGQSAGVQSVLNSYYMTGQTSGLYTFRVVDIAMAGANPVAQFVGSFRWSISSASGGINLALTNTTSFRSLFFDLGGQWQRFPLVTPYGTFTSPMGNTHQTYNIFAPCKAS